MRFARLAAELATFRSSSSGFLLTTSRYHESDSLSEAVRDVPIPNFASSSPS